MREVRRRAREAMAELDEALAGVGIQEGTEGWRVGEGGALLVQLRALGEEEVGLLVKLIRGCPATTSQGSPAPTPGGA